MLNPYTKITQAVKHKYVEWREIAQVLMDEIGDEELTRIANEHGWFEPAEDE